MALSLWPDRYGKDSGQPTRAAVIIIPELTIITAGGAMCQPPEPAAAVGSS